MCVMGVRGRECSLQEGLMRAQEGRAGAPLLELST